MERSEERELVLGLMKGNVLETETTAFVVSKEWWDNWLKYVDGQTAQPSRMSNDKILHGFNIRSENIVLIHPAAWEVLRSIYDSKPEVEVFIIDKAADLKPKNMYISVPACKVDREMMLISEKLTGKQFRDYIKRRLNIHESGGTLLYKNAEVEDTTVLQSLPKDGMMHFELVLASAQPRSDNSQIFVPSPHMSPAAAPFVPSASRLPAGPRPVMAADFEMLQKSVDEVLAQPRPPLARRSLREIEAVLDANLESLLKM
jgi:hypothetical protein